jgi:hypothetical protein
LGTLEKLKPLESPESRVRIGRRSQRHMERAWYLASVVLRAISDCSLLTQCMGHPQ